MLPCPDCNNPLTQFPIEQDDVDLVSCDGCFGVWLVHPGDDLARVDNVTFDDLVDAYGTEYPIEASGDAFIGSPNGVGNDGDAWVKYNFSIELDNWHFWGRVIAPSVADLIPTKPIRRPLSNLRANLPQLRVPSKADFKSNKRFKGILRQDAFIRA